MNIVNAGYEIMDKIDGEEILKKIELIGRTCYKSEDKITADSARKMVKSLIKRGHESVLEHEKLTVRFIVDRGVSHEIVRHRIASYSQESTRYCNYGANDGQVTFIRPVFFKDLDIDKVTGNTDDLTDKEMQFRIWLSACTSAEENYLTMLHFGATPQEARSVLPNSLKTEIVMTANLREWRHFFKLRAVGTTGAPHPQMTEVAIPLLKEVKNLIPVIFDDLEV